MAAINATPNAASIETHYVNAFRDGLEAVFQKTDSILLPHVETVQQNSEEQYYDRIGSANEKMKKDETRYGTNPNQEINFDRRRSVFEHYEDGKMIEEKDLLKIATDPTNEYNRALAAEARRTQDEIIINGAFASVWTGKKGETEVKWATDGNTDFEGKIKVGGLNTGLRNPITTTGRYVVEAGDYEGIAVDNQYSGNPSAPAASGITLAKLQAYRTTLIRLEVLNQQDRIKLFLGEQQIEELLNIPEIKNADYNYTKALADGAVRSFMGYDFIPYVGLPTGEDGDGNTYRRCLALPSTGTKMGTRKGVYLAQAKALTADMWRLPERKNIPYLYMSMACNAFRMWGEMVGEIRCTE